MIYIFPLDSLKFITLNGFLTSLSWVHIPSFVNSNTTNLWHFKNLHQGKPKRILHFVQLTKIKFKYLKTKLFFTGSKSDHGCLPAHALLPPLENRKALIQTFTSFNHSPFTATNKCQN